MYQVEPIENSFAELDNDYREGFLNPISAKSSEGTSGGVVAAVTILMTGKFKLWTKVSRKYLKLLFLSGWYYRKFRLVIIT